jgi:hypothetical protein
MATDILIHKNGYTKTHNSLIYGLIKNIQNHKVMNCHDKLYDLFFMFEPKKLFLQIEEYSNEWHSFIIDTGITNKPEIYLTIDNNIVHKDKYLDILSQIKTSGTNFIIPKWLSDEIKPDPALKRIVYNNLYNNDVFYSLESKTNRNDKILCILSDDTDCINEVKDYLYPNKMGHKMVMVNNAQVIHPQNIGIMLDSDMNVALNTYGSVIDLTKSYDAEIASCGIKKFLEPESNISEIVDTDTFIKEHIT